MPDILPVMQNWKYFTDSRFALGFRYPQATPQGHIVEWAESQKDDVVRVHFTSKDSQELYFEVTKYFGLPAQVEYQQHKESLEERPEEFVVSGLKEIHWMSQPAYEYSIKWDNRARMVILLETDDATYRILYDPYSPLNIQILSTLQWAY
jgi:hypothetical protein